MNKIVGSGVCGDVILNTENGYKTAIKSIPLKNIKSKNVTRNFGIPYMLKLKNIDKYEDNKGTWDPGINDINELIILNQLQNVKYQGKVIVPKIYKFDINTNCLKIEMEFFDYNVENYIRNYEITNKEFKMILFKMWNILKTINESGIKHLDTHGRNFLINKQKEIVIIDFGHSLTSFFKYDDSNCNKLFDNTYIDLAMNILHFCPNYLNKRFKSSYILEELYPKALKVFLNAFAGESNTIDFDLFQDAFNLLLMDEEDTLEV